MKIIIFDLLLGTSFGKLFLSNCVGSSFFCLFVSLIVYLSVNVNQPSPMASLSMFCWMQSWMVWGERGRALNGMRGEGPGSGWYEGRGAGPWMVWGERGRALDGIRGKGPGPGLYEGRGAGPWMVWGERAGLGPSRIEVTKYDWVGHVICKWYGDFMIKTYIRSHCHYISLIRWREAINSQ